VPVLAVLDRPHRLDCRLVGRASPTRCRVLAEGLDPDRLRR
jgi:hypothetical protein